MKTNNQLKRSLALLITLLAMVAVHADVEKVEAVDKVQEKEKDDNRAPIGCRDEGYKFDLEALHLLAGSNGEHQSMYLLRNQSNHQLNLFHMRGEESSRSMFLNHVIGPNEWGILSTGEKKVKFICTIPDKKSPYGQVVDCAANLLVCEYTNVRYGLNNRGNFWLNNSSTRNGAVSAVVHYGIIPGN
jgi:hypothetical protein